MISSYTLIMTNIVKALRVNQWLKNSLIFLPSIYANELDVSLFKDLCIVFFSFSLLVSSTYIINDINDVDSDRSHPEKKYRPIASGEYSLKFWLVLSIILFLISKITLYVLNYKLLIFSTSYLILTLLYTFKLKFIKFLDILVISILFLLRILIGGPYFNITISTYLYIFVFFICLGIVSGKKYSIRNNPQIINNNTKEFLLTAYKLKELKIIIYISFFASSFCYLSWVFDTTEFLSFEQCFLFLSSIFLVYFKKLFINQTLKNKTEDIFKIMASNTQIQFSLISFFISALIGFFL